MMEHTDRFLSEHPPMANKRVTSNNKFHNRMNSIKKKVFVTVTTLENVEDATVEVYNELHSYIRKKLGQGRQWSTGLLIAVTEDCKQYLTKMEDRMSVESEEEE